MAIQVQLRRGTTAENDAFTGAAGEVTVDTTLNQLRVHDGATPGGHAVSGAIANRTIYVSTTGSDTTGDGTSGNPYATITKALSVLPKNLGGFTATISVAAGTYTDTPLIAGFYAGNLAIAFAETVTINGQIKLLGNKAYITSTGTLAVTCAVANQGCIDVTDSFIRLYQDLTLSNSATDGRGINGSTGAFIAVLNDASNNTVSVSAASGRGVVSRLCAQVLVGSVSGTANIGYYSDGATIRVGTNSMTTTTKVTKTRGGTVLTGTGVDLV